MKSLLSITFLSTAIAVSARQTAEPQPQLQHANHIFNAIHSSMRQFGSSLNHNGMSIFLATVPENTEFYHGTGSPYRVNGTEWLAFEPEHALIFAGHGPPGGGKGRRPPPGQGAPPDHMDAMPRVMRDHDEIDDPPPPPPTGHGQRKPDLRRREKVQHPLDVMVEEKPDLSANVEETHGYLHTYRTKHALRLLYVDGQSAAKSEKGTLDVQDLVLLHHNPPTTKATPSPHSPDDERHHDFEGEKHGGSGPQPRRPPGQEHHENVENKLHDRVDGQGRPRGRPQRNMPESFQGKAEVTLHDRERQRHSEHKGHDDLERVFSGQKDRPGPPHHGPMGEGERAERLCRIAQEEYDDRIDGILRMEGGFEIILCDFAKHLDVVRITQSKSSSRGGPGGPGSNDGAGFNYYEAVAARYDGIGDGRVQLNYESFVSLFAFGDAVYFDDTGRPRVNNQTNAIEPARKSIKDMAISSPDYVAGKDWQAVADMVVARYADRIGYLSSGNIKDLKSFQAEVDRALRPFIDYGHRNSTAEISHCASQFLPSKPHNTESLAAASVRNVATVLCRTLSAASDIDTLPNGLAMIRALKSWLGWTTWKRCHCSEYEICFLPIWPQGSAEDFEQPQCKSAGDISHGRGGYWGGFGGPPRKDRDQVIDGYY
ncbi:hypothetical protein LTR08_009278 [Meristemomyces frigidus]|nr:hypothetical protein LTR08_009278 [Meristemomyces frigidus]